MNISRKIYLSLAICVSILIGSSFTANAQQASPQAQLRAIVEKLSTTKGSVIEYTATGDGRAATGSITTKGDKFRVTLDGSVTIYNGKEVWQANEFTREINIFTPEPEMLAEINPIALIKQSSGAFKATRLKSADNVIKLALTPDPAAAGFDGAEFTRIILAADKSTKLPKEAKVELKSGESIIFKFTRIDLNAVVADSNFKLDKSKFPGYEVIDLR